MELKRNVLVCEDDPVQLRVMAATFQRAGYAVAEASSPADALAHVKKARPDAIVADVQLRQGNGFDLVEALRASGLDIPVVMISASATEATRERAMALGVLNFFDKPIGVEALVRRVGEIVRLERARMIDGRILVVEDDPVARSLLSECLFQAGADVHVVEDGDQALQFLKSPGAETDIVLADLHIPGPSGPGLVEEMRKAVPGLFIVIVTGEAVREEIRAAFQAGAAALIRKPFSPKEVVAFIDRNIEGARRMREKARALERAAQAPWPTRARAWVLSYLRARKGSPKRKRLLAACLAAACLVLGVGLAVFIDRTNEALRKYEQESKRLLEALERHAGPDWRNLERKAPPNPPAPGGESPR